MTPGAHPVESDDQLAYWSFFAAVLALTLAYVLRAREWEDRPVPDPRYQERYFPPGRCRVMERKTP